MKTCTKCKVQKDPSLFSKKAEAKDGLQSKCKACVAGYIKANRESIAAKKVEYNKANREAVAARNAKYYQENHEAEAARNAKWYQENREAATAKRAEYYQENREAVVAKQAKYHKENRESIAAKNARWAKENPDKCRAISAKRRAAQLQRTPAWVDFEAIKAVYAEARRLEVLDGITRHVDHIIPLQGTTVSGFHVASNLQILTAQENLSKSNRFELTN